MITQFDFSEVIKELNLEEDEITNFNSLISNKIQETYEQKFTEIIKDLPDEERKIYQEAFIVNKNSDGVELNLEGDEANKLEEDSGPFDLKVGFSTSAKRKIKKDGGWYLIIPFRHATSKNVVNSSQFASILSRSLYDKARKTDKPLTKKDLSPKDRIPGLRKEINYQGIKIPEYMHKAPQYQGLIKVKIPGSSGSQYFTFRKVSDKSDPNSWIHPGMKGKKILDKLVDSIDIDSVVDEAISEYIENEL